jgi:hypothetical protein
MLVAISELTHTSFRAGQFRSAAPANQTQDANADRCRWEILGARLSRTSIVVGIIPS